MSWMGSSVDLSGSPRTIEERLAAAKHGEVGNGVLCDAGFGWEDDSEEVAVTETVFISQLMKKCRGCGVKVKVPIELEYVWHKVGCTNPGDLKVQSKLLGADHTRTGSRDPTLRKPLLHRNQTVLLCIDCGNQARIVSDPVECLCDYEGF
ncbi:MAG: hypothetical protein WD231_04970 [Candidatus Woykebacteria bacterium]